MALKILQPGLQPIGQFDGLDSEVLTLKGGEVVTLRSVAVSADAGAWDVQYDGYVNAGVPTKTVVTKTLASGKRPLMLADEGISGYGTLFGSVVGGTVGQVSTGGAQLGPHTATGSGKVTCWSQPGLYAVSLDACDTNATTGLQPTNATLIPGAALYATTSGVLTPAVGSAFESVAVGRFVSFETNGSLVTSQNQFTSALNSPSGTAAPARTFAFATFFFTPAL